MSDSTSPKCTWETATQNHIVSCLPDRNHMIDWSLTKYKGRKNYENYPLDHKVEYFVDKFISYEIPGCVANKIYEFPYDNNKKAYRFIPNKNYSYLEINKICEGVLYGVLAKTDNTIVVTYSPYDHKNEPIITEEFVLTDAKNE